MQVLFYWKRSLLFDNTDAYFIEIKDHELTDNILNLMTDNDLENIKHGYLQSVNDWTKNNLTLANMNCYYLLVSNDIKKIKLMEPQFPYSGMWNAANPLIAFNMAISNISDVKKINKMHSSRQGTNFFNRINVQFKRALSDILSEKRLTKFEWVIIKSYFNNHCVFCGSPDTNNPRTGLVPDHLIPSNINGETTIGNIVPACHHCNDKRRDSDWKEYLLNMFPEEASSRITKIKEYLIDYPYVAHDGYGDLNELEKDEFMEILKEWDSLLQRMKRFRETIGKRRRFRDHPTTAST